MGLEGEQSQEEFQLPPIKVSREGA